MGRYSHPKEQWIDQNGDPLAGGKLYFYVTGTSTPKDTYTTEGLSVANANPVVADSTGAWSDIWLTTGQYKVVLKDANDVQIWSADPVDGKDAETVTFNIALEHTVNAGSSTPSTGVSGDLYVPFACTITAWTIMADITGSIVFDVWKKAFVADSPPTVANTITASAKPTLSAAKSARSTTLTGWTTSVSDGDHIRFNIDSCSTLHFATLIITATRTLST